MIKAIFIDIDGTLRDSNRNLSVRTIETIKRVSEKGILVILCSGRPRKYTEQISRECFASQYIITSSGGNIYNYEQNKILYVNKMDKEALIKLYEIANPEDVRFIMNVGEGRVVNKVKHADQEKKLEENIKDFVYKNDVVQCTIADSNFDKIKNLIPKIENVENVEIKNRHKSLLDSKFKDDKTVFCDIANIDSNKGIAVKKMLEILNIRKEETIAIGDDNNDLSMFEQVGYNVAVDNAIDIVKEKADEITLSNDEDGVAVFLDKLLKELELLEKLNKFYIYANEGLYIDKIIKNSTYTMTYSKYVKDYDCNYVIDVNSNEDFDKIETKMKKVDRIPCYIVTPLSNIYKDRNLIFDKNRYNEASNEVWQIYEDFDNIDKINSKCTLNVELEKTNDMKKLAEITYKSFCTGDESDPYGDFDSGYLKLYENYDNKTETTYIREFYFIKVNNEIVGCTVSVFDDEIFGIYGIAIMKEYRGKGIGTEAIKQQLKICKQKNKKIAFLQTEDGFYPANLYRKIGFKDICNVYYYIKKD